MKKGLLFVLLALTFNKGFSQSASDTITVKEGRFWYHDVTLKPVDMLRLMQPNEAAFKKMKASRVYNGFGTFFSFAGGVMIGFPLGQAIGGKKDPQWALLGIGAGLVGVSIPFAVTSNKKRKEAVALYNGGLKTSSYYHKRELLFQLSDNGVGIAFKF